jgi:Xaa-Pro aminopeptidase
LRLTEALPKAQIKDGTAALTEMRLIKSPEEIAYMSKACEISMKAYDRCLPQLKPGMTRREIADRLYISMIEAGAHPRHPGFLMLNSSTRYDETL